jgi:hypothetical protein
MPDEAAAAAAPPAPAGPVDEMALMQLLSMGFDQVRS